MIRFAVLLADDLPRDITGPEWTGVADGGLPLWPWPIALVAAALAIAVVLWSRRRRTLPAATDAAVLAARRLDRLRRLDLLEKKRPERHYTLLACILRRFLAKRYGVPARRLTTPELLAAAARDPRLGEHVGFLASFLFACDIARFARPPLDDGVGRDLDAQLARWLADLAPAASREPKRGQTPSEVAGS